MINVQFKLSNSDTLRTFNVDFPIRSYCFNSILYTISVDQHDPTYRRVYFYFASNVPRRSQTVRLTTA